MKKISESEMEIMDIIWNSNANISTNDILDKLPKNQWKTTTVLTLVSRLAKKGYLESKKIGKTNHYTYLISEAEYKQMCTKDFLEEIHQGSIKNFFASLYSGGNIKQKDLDELKKILEEDEEE